MNTPDIFAPDQEAETGSRTLVAHAFAGVDCWDWTTLAPCTGGDYAADGWLGHDTEGAQLPWAYGTAFDGSCVLGLGDPGLVFSVDPKGSSPCSSLGAASRTLDLRKQRCDGGVGGATWSQASLQDAMPGELQSVVLTVKDAASGEVLATKDISSGPLDLTGINAAAHPAITVVATARSAPGDTAWADAVPPRIRVAWHGDPKQLCFETTTAPACEVTPVSVRATLGDVFASKQVAVLPTGCLPPPPAPSAPEAKRAADLVLGCSDRRVVLEDVFIEGSEGPPAGNRRARVRRPQGHRGVQRHRQGGGDRHGGRRRTLHRHRAPAAEEAAQLQQGALRGENRLGGLPGTRSSRGA